MDALDYNALWLMLAAAVLAIVISLFWPSRKGK